MYTHAPAGYAKVQMQPEAIFQLTMNKSLFCSSPCAFYNQFKRTSFFDLVFITTTQEPGNHTINVKTYSEPQCSNIPSYEAASS